MTAEAAPPASTDDPGVRAVLDTLVTMERQRLAGAAEAVEARLAGLGALERREGRLLLGGHPLEEHRGALADLTRTFACGVSIYGGNRCLVSLPGPDEGIALAPGAFAPAILVDEVLRQGNRYDGITEHPSRVPAVSAARPLRGTGGSDAPVGIVEVHAALSRLEGQAWDLAAAARGRVASAALDERTLADLRRLLDDLSQRLQLLALNGNILAAQAGEQGKAFRVVFRELGALAERTAQARRSLPGAPQGARKFDRLR